MRKKLINVAILVIAFCFSGNAGNQIPSQPLHQTTIQAESSNELIVTFENLSMKQYEALDIALADIPGVKLVGYCQKQNCYYFHYDQSAYRSGEEAFDALTLNTKLYQPLMKTGVTIALIQTLCQQ
ncbi:MAG: hypothetical protein ACO1O6_07710 [Bacteroidota bacterium]